MLDARGGGERERRERNGRAPEGKLAHSLARARESAMYGERERREKGERGRARWGVSPRARCLCF